MNVIGSSFWFGRHVSPIAVDFGHRVVRMLQLARYRSHSTLIRYAQRELPVGVDDPGHHDRLCAEAARDMLAGENFIGRDAVTSLDWEDITIRSLRLPAMPAAELKDAVQREAAERLGLRPDTTEIRFIVAGDVRQGTTIGQEIIVLAAGRPAIESRVDMLAALGLRPTGLDAAPCAVFRSFERFLRRDEDRGKAAAFVEVGYTASHILVSRGGDLVFIKSVPVGGRSFDELVSRHTELSLSDAATLRIRLHRYHAALLTGQTRSRNSTEAVSDSMRRAMIDAMRPALDHLGTEIAQGIRYSAATFRGPRVESVTVVGGEACNSDMLQLLSDQIDLPFEVGKPLRYIAIEPALQGSDRRTGQPEWATVLGLALKSVKASVVKS